MCNKSHMHTVIYPVSSLQVCVWFSLNCFGCVYLWLITRIRLPTGPLGTSCLCSCHSSRFEKAHITLPLPQWQDRIKRSPVPGERKWNPRADLLRRCCETPLKNRPPQQNARHFSNRFSSISFTLRLGFQTWCQCELHKSFFVEGFS